ncbi:MAG: NAD-binding protein [Anaerolineae bacterium]|nr:NAD-binding protein [Chloroflexota bacterium]MBP6298628.1 NAD-binding protein [Anaerolineae bacterium]
MKIIIVGCGRVGQGLAQAMSRKGHLVTVVDKDPKAFHALNPAPSIQCITGIGFDRDVLIQAGIERTDGLAAVTDSDEANLVTGQLARQVFHIPKVVARVYDSRQAEIYRRLGLQVIATTSWGVNRIAEILTYSSLDPVLNLGNGEVDILQSSVPLLLVGRTVNELTIPGEVSVIAITRRDSAFLPTLGTVFEAGDHVHLAVITSAMRRLSAMLQPD